MMWIRVNLKARDESYASVNDDVSTHLCYACSEKRPDEEFEPLQLGLYDD